MGGGSLPAKGRAALQRGLCPQKNDGHATRRRLRGCAGYVSPDTDLLHAQAMSLPTLTYFMQGDKKGTKYEGNQTVEVRKAPLRVRQSCLPCLQM